MTTTNDPDPFYLPTPAEIRRECAAIQSTWDRREEMLRRGVDPDRRLAIPRVRTGIATPAE